MSAPGTPGSGNVPAGATIQPRYMGRIVNTYPVSEPEMEMISALSSQGAIRFSVASLLLGLASSVWISALFYDHLTPAGELGVRFAAPLLLVFAIGFFVGGCWAQYRRKSKWELLKKESVPMQTIAQV